MYTRQFISVIVMCLFVASHPVYADDPAPDTTAALVYFDNSPEMQDLYDSAITALSNQPGFVITTTADSTEFEDAITNSDVEVMVAVSTDTNLLESWVAQGAMVPTLAVVTPDDQGGYALKIAQYKFFDPSAAQLPAPDLIDVAESATAAAAAANEAITAAELGDTATTAQAAAVAAREATVAASAAQAAVGTGILGVPSVDEIWEKLKTWIDQARDWIGEKMQKLGRILQDLNGNADVETTIHIGEPTGSVWVEVTIKGDKEAVGEALEKIGELIESD